MARRHRRGGAPRNAERLAARARRRRVAGQRRQASTSTCGSPRPTATPPTPVVLDRVVGRLDPRGARGRQAARRRGVAVPRRRGARRRHARGARAARRVLRVAPGRRPATPARCSSSPAARASCRCTRWPRPTPTPATRRRSGCCTPCARPTTCTSRTSCGALAGTSAPLRLDLVYTRAHARRLADAAGRITREALEAAVIPAAESPRVYVCGSTGFVERVADWLVGLGHDPRSVRTERYGGM